MPADSETPRPAGLGVEGGRLAHLDRCRRQQDHAVHTRVERPCAGQHEGDEGVAVDQSADTAQGVLVGPAAVCGRNQVGGVIEFDGSIRSLSNVF